MTVSWIVYSRPDCGLCEEFLIELGALLGERANLVQVINIESDLELTKKYGQRIPVLIIDDDFVCSYRVDVGRVGRYL